MGSPLPRKRPGALSACNEPHPSGREERTDEALLRAIARDRSQEAFDQLFQRRLPQAFQLAGYLCGDHTDAEEAVQEAMVRVWRSAQLFIGGDGRAWLLRIVAREALRQRRKTGRSKRRQLALEEQPAGPPDLAPRDPGGCLEEREELATLRTHLAALTPADRQLLALHFGAGCTHVEISELFRIPKSTVSARVNRILEELRWSLKGAGLSGLALRPDCGLEALFVQGGQVPAALYAAAARIAAAPAPAPAAAFTRTHAAWLAAAGTALFALAMGIAHFAWAAGNPRAEGARPAPAGRQGPLPAVADPKTFQRRWTFENGPPTDLSLLAGAWAWFPPQEDIPGAMAVGEQEAICQLPPIPPGSGLRMRCEIQPLAPHLNLPNKVLALWTMERKTRAFQYGVLHSSVQLGDSDWLVVESTFFEDFDVCTLNGRLHAIREYDGALPGQRLALKLKDYLLRSIEVHSASPKELAAARALAKPDVQSWQGAKWDKLEDTAESSLPAPQRLPLQARQWRLHAAPPGDLTPFHGLWTWRPADGGVPAGLELPTDPNNPLSLRLPIKASIHPLLLKIEVHTQAGVPWEIFAKCSRDRGLGYLFRIWDAKEEPAPSGSGPATVTYLFDRRYDYKLIDGVLVQCKRYNVPWPWNRIDLKGVGCRIVSMEIRELDRASFARLAPAGAPAAEALLRRAAESNASGRPPKVAPR